MTPALLGALVAASTFAAALLVLAPSRRALLRERVAAHVAPATAAPPSTAERARATHLERLLAASERRLAGTAAWRRVERAFDRAGVGARPVLVVYEVALAGMLAGVLLAVGAGSPAVLPLGPIASTAAGWLLLRIRAARRLRAFDDQLPDLLSTLGGSLKAGHSFIYALQAVAEESAEPAAREFRRVIAELRLGRPVDEALGALAERIPSAELHFVLTAVTIQRQVGGSLAGLLEIVTDTVRQRQQFARKLRAATGMGRLSAAVLVALPPLVALALTALNPAYMRPLYTTSTGRLLVVAAAAMIALGTLLLRRIVTVRG